jgi:quinohemoprotein amine dehydrogenase
MTTQRIAALSLVALLASAPAALAQSRGGPAAVAKDEGIPIESELVRSKCGGCHRSDDQHRMSRISYRRASPENWQRTIERMVSINHAVVSVDEARGIIKYLSDHLGLAPQEARPAQFDYERRMVDYSYAADKETADLCTGCHSFGRVLSERRTTEEWGLLIAMHRGYFPLTDNQPIANGQGFRRSRAVTNEPGADGRPPDTRQPMDKAIAHLSKVFPLMTPEWATWSASATSPRLAGRWALTGSMSGKGPVFGEMIVTADPSAPDSFTTETHILIAGTGQSITRTGKGILYTGYQWRGRGSEIAKSDEPWREVLFVERDRAEMWGRWFTGAYDETGVDVRLTRLTGAPLILGTAVPGIKAGTSRTLTIFGASLPATIAVGDIDLGPGITVTRLASASPSTVTLEISVAKDARPGPRDIAIAGAIRPSGLLVYQKVDGIRVLPRAGMARVGGIGFPKQFQQFEAMAFANGPDGKPDTDDDWPLGLVDVRWGIEEYASTFGDDDLKWVGAIDPATGLFTPNVDGPNPERSGNRNNVGDVWVTAEYSPGGEERPIKGRAHLLVTVPLYMGWGTSEVAK